MKIVVLGKTGQLGRCLVDQFQNSREEVFFFGRSEIDVSDFDSVAERIKKISPDVIINATAYTAVDNAESDEKLANLLNNLAVENLAKICATMDSWLIHVSTDYVFDGLSNCPYVENDPVNPKSVYGVSKLKGELALASSSCKYLVIRTAWVFSEYENNFLKTMLRLALERDEISIVGDQVGCPTYGQDLAAAIVVIAEAMGSRKVSSGIYHYCGDRSCSWYEFAKVIFEESEGYGIQAPNKIRSIRTSDYPTAAERPGYSVLDCSKIEQEFDISKSDWRLGVKSSIEALN